MEWAAWSFRVGRSVRSTWHPVPSNWVMMGKTYYAGLLGGYDLLTDVGFLLSPVLLDGLDLARLPVDATVLVPA